MGAGCDGSIPITMIPKASDDDDTTFVQFSGSVSQKITFTHTSGVSESEDIDSNNLYMIMTAKCSQSAADAPWVSESVRARVGSCIYDIAIPCNKDDMCDRRRMNEESFTHDSPDKDADDEEEDVPYCLAEDFPCEGQEDKMVYVCHYIPRQGYQTFCVPEADTAILGFYPHDYCGPCEGGYRTVEK